VDQTCIVHVREKSDFQPSITKPNYRDHPIVQTGQI